jgi:hypothetical protein
MHYVLHEIATGELIETSEEPFKAEKMIVGRAIEFFDIDLPDPDNFYWHPKYLMWRRK